MTTHRRPLNMLTISAAMLMSVATGHAMADRVTTSQEGSPQTKMAQQVQLQNADQAMLMKLAQGNMAEIAAAEVAQTKSSDPQVLQFARQMKDDHTKALKKIGDLAKKKDQQLPKAADAKHAEALKKMNAMSGAEFDRHYLAKAGKEDHQETLALLKEIQANANDADLKALAKELQPTVESHLQMANRMDKH